MQGEISHGKMGPEDPQDILLEALSSSKAYFLMRMSKEQA